MDTRCSFIVRCRFADDIANATTSNVVGVGGAIEIKVTVKGINTCRRGFDGGHHDFY